MAYWDNWHGCCDCCHGMIRGKYDLERYGNTWCQFKCVRKDDVASSYHKPDDSCEHYERKKK